MSLVFLSQMALVSFSGRSLTDPLLCFVWSSLVGLGAMGYWADLVQIILLPPSFNLAQGPGKGRGCGRGHGVLMDDSAMTLLG